MSSLWIAPTSPALWKNSTRSAVKSQMRNLYESLDEVTVKDTLEGDNMYTCSTCGKKVRADKRACWECYKH